MTISIIIPVYQVAPYIETCLCSVMQQTWSGDMECLLVDDCGTDDSMSIAERMIAAYEGPIRFSFLHHDRNRGLSAARNTGTAAATGKYIYYLDSDDELTPDCLEKLARPVLADASIEMVLGNYALVTDGSKVASFEQPVALREEKLDSLAAVRDSYFNRRGFYVYAWNKLIRKDFLVRNQLLFEEGLLWEDYLWTFFVLKHLSRLYVIPDVTYKYFKRPRSITTQASKVQKARHMGHAYAEIAHHFTSSETGLEAQREARRYVKGFCYCFAQDPRNPEFLPAARLYAAALSAAPCPKEKLMIRTTVAFSQLALGRTLLRLGVKAVDRLV